MPYEPFLLGVGVVRIIFTFARTRVDITSALEDFGPVFSLKLRDTGTTTLIWFVFSKGVRECGEDGEKRPKAQFFVVFSMTISFLSFRSSEISS